MKIAYLGAGAWGFSLANHLANKGHAVHLWTTNKELCDSLNARESHPRFQGVPVSDHLTVSTDLRTVLEGAEFLVESVTSAGIRPVFSQVQALGGVSCPIVLTSKGIEQNSGWLLSEVLIDLFGESIKNQISYLSGPSFASDVARGCPTSVVASAYDADLTNHVCELFNTNTFRVYPNKDIRGVAFGGALKNIIAIACGACIGLGLGESSKAALLTRGLHEMCKLAVAVGCDRETLYGLSGLGDLCLTCSGTTSRNFLFGKLVAEGLSVEEAKKKIGMVVEGAYSCLSALQLSRKLGVPMPITEGVCGVIYKNIDPKLVMALFMSRAIKEEHL